MQLRYAGPYIVVERVADVIYRIQLSRNSKIRTVHFNRLKLYQGREKLTSWLDPIEANPPQMSREQVNLDGSDQAKIQDGIDVELDNSSIEWGNMGDSPAMETIEPKVNPNLPGNLTNKNKETLTKDSEGNEQLKSTVSEHTAGGQRRNPRRNRRLPWKNADYTEIGM